MTQLTKPLYGAFLLSAAWLLCVGQLNREGIGMETYFMSGKFYVNNGDEKSLAGYFSTTAESAMTPTETFKAMFDAVVDEHKVHTKMVCVEQFNKV